MVAPWSGLSLCEGMNFPWIICLAPFACAKEAALEHGSIFHWSSDPMTLCFIELTPPRPPDDVPTCFMSTRTRPSQFRTVNPCFFWLIASDGNGLR